MCLGRRVSLRGSGEIKRISHKISRGENLEKRGHSRPNVFRVAIGFQHLLSDIANDNALKI